MGTFRLAARAAAALLIAALASCDSTSPPVAFSIVLVDAGPTGVVGQELNPSPTFEVRDRNGNRMGGVVFTVTVVSGGGAVTQTPARTLSTGPTSVGTWTLGQTAGANSIRISSQGVEPLTVSATAEAGSPATTSSGGGPLTAAGLVGAVSVIQPSIRVMDQFGNPVAGVTVSVTVSDGGTVQNPSPVTNANGIASAGTWTLGPVAGEQTARLSVGVNAPVVTFRVQADPAPAVAAQAAVPQTVEAVPGQVVPLTPTIRVVDQYGNGISGVPVTAVASAGGSVTQPASTTNANGEANAGLWTVGQAEGENTVTMTASGFAPVVFTANVVAPAFNMEVRYYGATQPTAALVTAINNAISRIQQVITTDIPDQPVINANLGGCFPGLAPLNEVVDDIIVFARIAPLDGSGGTLAAAGPCMPGRAAAPNFPFVAGLDVDQADLASMTANGTLQSVITHELLHAVGMGTLWKPFSNWNFNFIQGSGTASPRFTGPLARTAYLAAGGTAASGVPVENVGGPGTVESHWRQTSFGNEMMVGVIVPNVFRPLSAVTIQSLADMGYQVNPGAADPFSVNPGGQAGIRAAQEVISLGNDVLPPRFITDIFGRPWVPPPAIERVPRRR